MMTTIALLLLQANEALVAEVVEMDTFSWIFMFVSMGTATLLTVYCFTRILRGRRHFDPDGTGPDVPPEPGRVEKP